MLREEKIRLVRRQGAFVGVDVARRSHFVQFLDNYGERISKGTTISNDREGLVKLENILGKAPNLDHNILFGFEPTGDYWKPLAYHLKGKGYQVVLVNPYHLKRTKEIIDNSQDKTDRKDAYLIADLCRQGKFFFPVISSGVYAEIREVSLSWQRTNKQLTRAKTYLYNFLAKYFPEYKGTFSDVTGITSFYLLNHFPLPSDIKRLGKKRLLKISQKVSKGRIKEEKILLLYQRAITSIGLQAGSETAKILLKDILFDLKKLKERKEKLKRLMKELLFQTGYKDYLLSIPAVGVVTASLFLGEIGDPKNYTSSPQIEKLAGLNLVEQSSGERKGKRKISKRGRSLLRYVGYLVTNVAISKNKEIKALYQYKLLNSKREKMQILTGIAAKMLRLMFALCKNHSFYNPEEVKRYWR